MKNVIADPANAEQLATMKSEAARELIEQAEVAARWKFVCQLLLTSAEHDRLADRELRHVDDDRVHLQVGPMLYELLVPAADVAGSPTDVGET